MKINKAIKKENRHKKYFFSLMLILFVMLPLTTFLAGINSLFIWGYLGIIELLIILACIIKGNYYRLDFHCSNNKLRFKSGIFIKENVILCDKVAIIHTFKEMEELEIVIITPVRFRNNGLKAITKAFIKKYPEAAEEYLRLKRMNPENIYYFQVVRRGALKKYSLLDTIYKNCVRAAYTTSAIDNIKIARGQIEF
ncbi:hypothetical protein JCM1393_16750 [Clostridium carnis]